MSGSIIQPADDVEQDDEDDDEDEEGVADMAEDGLVERSPIGLYVLLLGDGDRVGVADQTTGVGVDGAGGGRPGLLTGGRGGGGGIVVAESAGIDPNLCKGGVGLLPCGPSVVGPDGVGGGRLLAHGVGGGRLGGGRVGADGGVGLCGHDVGGGGGRGSQVVGCGAPGGAGHDGDDERQDGYDVEWLIGLHIL